jgi:hypothetical protein
MIPGLGARSTAQTLSQASIPIIPTTEFVLNGQDGSYVVSIPGRYQILNWFDARGNQREFACRVMSMSPRRMVLAVPVMGIVGKGIIAHIKGFGRLEGSIVGHVDRGIVISIRATDDERNMLAAKLRWHQQHENDEVHDSREHERIAPKCPHSTLLLHDGTTLPCFVIDFSGSGAAVSADIAPNVGMPLAVGKMIGRVMRHFAEGFAIQFIEFGNPAIIEGRLIQPES